MSSLGSDLFLQPCLPWRSRRSGSMGRSTIPWGARSLSVLGVSSTGSAFVRAISEGTTSAAPIARGPLSVSPSSERTTLGLSSRWPVPSGSVSVPSSTEWASFGLSARWPVSSRSVSVSSPSERTILGGSSSRRPVSRRLLPILPPSEGWASTGSSSPARPLAAAGASTPATSTARWLFVAQENALRSASDLGFRYRCRASGGWAAGGPTHSSCRGLRATGRRLPRKGASCRLGG